jgi:hypothetical protein
VLWTTISILHSPRAIVRCSGQSFSKAKHPENGCLGLLSFMDLKTDNEGGILSQEIKSRVGYTYQALAEATGLSKRFWRLQVAEGKIPFVKFNQAVLILPADLEQFLASRRRVKSDNAQEKTRVQEVVVEATS